MLDAANLLGVTAVPYTFLIDEHGIIRFRNPKSDDLKTFLGAVYDKPAEVSRPTLVFRDSAEEKLLWGGDTTLNEAIGLLTSRTRAEPKNAEAFFRLGVAHRRRYDSPLRQDDDFAQAIGSWKAALALNPNQYIWRRRIQQYGPRLDKPYSFYDWVNKAREEITARGEKPHPLIAEPSGAEFAYPEKKAGEASKLSQHPDPEGKVHRDQQKLVQVKAVAVPSTKGDAKAYRVHLRFTPNEKRKVHWSNDAGPLTLIPEAADAVEVAHFQDAPKPPNELTSAETRQVEFEIRAKDGQAFPKTLTCAAFYYVCEDVNGQCLYLRQDVQVDLDS